MVDAARDILTCKNKRNSSIHVTPGWNDYVRDVHAMARESFLTWQAAGKPRNGLVFDIMKRSRAIFIYAMRHCKRAEAQTRADKLASNMSSKNYRCFWNDIRKAQMNKTACATCIDSLSGAENIVKMWEEHFRSVWKSSIQ